MVELFVIANGKRRLTDAVRQAPGNAAASGVNIPGLQIRMSFGETLLGASARGRAAGVRTHGRDRPADGDCRPRRVPRRLLAELRDAVLRRGQYADSAKQLTPIIRDPLRLLPTAFIAGRLLWAPSHAARIAAAAVDSYSITPTTIATVSEATRP